MALHRSLSCSNLLRSLTLGLLLASCSPDGPQTWSGYAVGDFVYISPAIAGRLEKLWVQPGDTVQVGQALYDLEDEVEQASSQESLDRLNNARSLANDLDKGRRADEIAVTQAQLDQALASEKLTNTNLLRQRQLFEQSFISKSAWDDALNNVQVAQARVAELTASLQVAKLPAREDAQKAGRANALAAADVLRQNLWRTKQKHLQAPVQGLVNELFFRTGELIGVSQPVLSLLPPSNIKARFFVNETDLSQMQLGQTVQIQCDACGPPIQAKITRISSQAEYTPPVIYSNAQRSKLVYLIEAHPSENDAPRLHPGQPIDVSRVLQPLPHRQTAGVNSPTP